MSIRNTNKLKLKYDAMVLIYFKKTHFNENAK